VRATVFTLFPEIVTHYCSLSLLGRGLERGLWQLEVVNPRDYGDKQGRVDDSPCGGGNGMIMRADVLGRALDSTLALDRTKIYYMSPRGRLLDQHLLAEMAEFDELALICGRYGGVDQRVLEEYRVEEVSLGDFVLMGGELAALVLLEGVLRYDSRLIEKEALEEDSFGAGRSGKYENLLEYPLYTGPRSWRGREVPPVLLSGNPRDIERWKLEEARALTRERRPDLYRKHREKFPQ
jgi:tRNA (guanine37-N1)-methyltransferase